MKKLTSIHKKKIGLSVSNEKNGMWKGNKAGLDAIHIWVLRNKPKPKVCECCKKNKPKDLANISQKYRRDIKDFEWLCRKCHMMKDGRLKAISIRNKKRRLKKRRCVECKKWFKPAKRISVCCSLSCASSKGNKIRWNNKKIKR